MKNVSSYLLRIILFLYIMISGISIQAQVKFVKTNNVELIGKIDDSDTFNRAKPEHYAHLKKINEKGITFYELKFRTRTYKDNREDYFCSKTTKFKASANEIYQIYLLILKEYDNKDQANTEIRLGSKTLSVGFGTGNKYAKIFGPTLEMDYYSKSGIKIYLDDCVIKLSKQEWKTLFGR